ncbi:MFS transporter [Streptomyces sp. NPDC085524]|uniref:MFS transporter n=1 Tax=Streptomyces sp. NPDC085524 TaxID=3365728 RepID=UPI0037D45576
MAATGTGVQSRPRAVLPALCVTQITSWGIVYYAFLVLNPAITDDTGWSTGATTAAFSAALIVSAVAGIYVGRVLDHRGPRIVMTAGSVLGVLSLLVMAAAPNLAVFFAGWLLAGAAMAEILCQPAFAALTRWWAPDHVRAPTIVTLAGGLASTVFAPLTAVLADHMSWRATYVVLAGILAVLTVPAHAFVLKAPWPPPPPNPAHVTGGHEQVVRSRAFGKLAVTFTLSAFAMYAVVIGLVPLLIERGYTTTAVTDRWGTTHYGRLSGLLSAPAHATAALAPFAGAVLAGPLGGYPALFALLSVLSAAAAVIALRARP